MEWRQRLVVAVACLVAAGCASEPEPGAYAPELWAALEVGDVEEVRALLKAGADPNARKDLHGERHTPLHFAARGGNGVLRLEAATEVVKLLLKAGASPNANDWRGDAPGWTGPGFPEVEKILDDAGRRPRPKLEHDPDSILLE